MGEEKFDQGLWQRSKDYAKKQLDAKDNGANKGGIKNVVARAFAHGFIAGNHEGRELKPTSGKGRG